MGCDYYVRSEIVIEYYDKINRICSIRTGTDVKAGYVPEYCPDYDSDDDIDTQYDKFRLELERKIKENTYNKILYSDGKWFKESYKKKYEDYLLKTFEDISKFIKVYKNVHAWERI